MGTSEESSSFVLNGQTVPFNLTELDREVLAQTDDEFRPHDWEDLKKIVGGLASISILYCRGPFTRDL